MVSQGFNLLNNCSIQNIAVGIATVAALPLATFFHLTHIGVNRFPVCSLPLGQLGIHPITAGAKQQAGQQSLIVPGLAVCLGLVSVQGLLHLDPLLRGNETRMLTNGNNPFADRKTLEKP